MQLWKSQIRFYIYCSSTSTDRRPESCMKWQGAQVWPAVKVTARRSIELWQTLKSAMTVSEMSLLNLSVSLIKTWPIDVLCYDLPKCHILNTFSHVLNVSRGQHVFLKRNNLVTFWGALKNWVEIMHLFLSLSQPQAWRDLMKQCSLGPSVWDRHKYPAWLHVSKRSDVKQKPNLKWQSTSSCTSINITLFFF